MTRTRLTRTRILTLAMVALATISACTSAEEKERRRTAAMIEQAKADAAAESSFVADSIKLKESIVLDTVDVLADSMALYTDDDGNTTTDHVYLARTRTGATCEVDMVHYATMMKGDTLSCQWDAHK
jgi:hypothetical protein